MTTGLARERREAQVTILEHAHQRLEHLYEISKLFANFESIQQTLDPALEIVTKTLPLLSVIMIESDEHHCKVVSWPSDGHSLEAMHEGRQHLEGAYRYLVGTEKGSFARCDQEGHAALPSQAAAQVGLVNRFIVIPLVVGRSPPFGALQLESARPLNERDLTFVNAIANQLAVALERDRAWRKDVAQRLAAEALREKYEAMASENARLYEQARKAASHREQILAIVSHDLRSPLSTILVTSAMMARGQAEGERRKGLPQAVARIKRSAERMMRMIEDLLDFASIEAGCLAITRQSEDADSITQEVLASFEGTASEKRLQLTSHSGLNLPYAYCDRERLIQVLSNMVSNAIKATAEGGNIQLRVNLLDEKLLFSVSDTGRGIADEDKQHVFERYFRSTDSHYNGAGLGLAIAKGIVEAHGGKIWVESELARGTTFFFTVPPSHHGEAREAAVAAARVLL